MSAISDYLSSRIDFDDTKLLVKACHLAANHILDLEDKHREELDRLHERIADLEALFEPFLKNFLKERNEPVNKPAMTLDVLGRPYEDVGGMPYT